MRTVDPGDDLDFDAWCAAWAYGPPWSTANEICDFIYAFPTGDDWTTTISSDFFRLYGTNSSLYDLVHGCENDQVYTGDATPDSEQGICVALLPWYYTSAAAEEPPPEEPPPAAPVSDYTSLLIVIALAAAIVAVAISMIAGAKVFRRG